MERWTPEDIERISADVAALPGVQQELLEHASLSLKVADRVAHQYQIAGDRANSIVLPETEFGLARKIAYGMSQEGRGVLPEAEYMEVFSRGAISDALAAELRRRREMKKHLHHVDAASD